MVGAPTAGHLVDHVDEVVRPVVDRPLRAELERLRRELDIRMADPDRPITALSGASEVALALTMATVTTIIVFLPMIIMSEAGMMRFFLVTLSLPVVVSILASLLVAMLFVPLAACCSR